MLGGWSERQSTGWIINARHVRRGWLQTHSQSFSARRRCFGSCIGARGCCSFTSNITKKDLRRLREGCRGDRGKICEGRMICGAWQSRRHYGRWNACNTMHFEADFFSVSVNWRSAAIAVKKMPQNGDQRNSANRSYFKIVQNVSLNVLQSQWPNVSHGSSHATNCIRDWNLSGSRLQVTLLVQLIDSRQYCDIPVA